MRVRWTAMGPSVGGVAVAGRVRTAAPWVGDPTMSAVDVIRVHGGTRLAGEVPVVGAKNSALKLMAAALLAPGRSVLSNVPHITDMALMAEVLRRLGCTVDALGGTDGLAAE